VQLYAKNQVLHRQLNILRRNAPKKSRLLGGDRALFAWLYRRRTVPFRRDRRLADFLK